MSLEIPSDLIREIQTTLRKRAGIPPSFDPSDPSSLPPLPSLHDVIAGLDPPSLPPHLRCVKCRHGGGLLRGAHSTLCVFCGQNQRKNEALVHSISFSSTFACKNLLQSLQLDGSEVIDLDTESNDSNKREGTPRSGVVLSSVLDLELTWPPEREEEEEKEVVEKSADKAPAASAPAVNLSGVDLDSFFTDSNSKDADVTSEELKPKEVAEGAESRDFSGLQSFDLFKDYQSTDVVVSSANADGGGVFGDSFADWEGGFQSASTEALDGFRGASVVAAESRSVDLFEGSDTEFSSFEAGASASNQLANVEQERSNENNSGEAKSVGGGFSSTGKWIQDDFWPNAADQLKNTSGNRETEDDEVWPTTSDMKESGITEGKHDDNSNNYVEDDSWQDFASSMETPGISSSSLMHSDNKITSKATSSMKESSNTESIHDDYNNALDPWQYLASSKGSPGVPSSSWVQSDNEITTKSTTSTKESSNTGSKHDDNDDLEDALDSWQGLASLNEAPKVSSSSSVHSENEITSKPTTSMKESSITESEHDDDDDDSALEDALDSWQGASSTPGVSSSSWIHSDNDFTTKRTSSIKESADTESKHEECNNALGDALDTWQYLASSNEAPGISSTSWIQSGNEITPKSTSNMKESSITESKHDNNNNDLEDAFDSWQDFASSKEAPGVSSSSWIHADNEITPKTTTSMNESGNTESKHEDNNNAMEDALDSWQNFDSSNEAPGVSSGSWMRSSNEITSNENVSASKSMDLQDMDFGNFFHIYTSKGGTHDEKVHKEVNDIQFTGSTSNSKVHEFDNIESSNSNSLDPSKDFTSINGPSGDLLNSLKQTTTDFKFNEHSSGTKTLDLQDMDFGSFFQSDFFSGALGGQQRLTMSSVGQLDASVATCSSKEFDDTKRNDDNNDDSLDAWNDFTNSKEVPGDLPNSSMTSTEVTPNECAPEIKSVDQSDFHFGSFVHSDLFSGVDDQKGSSKVNDIQSHALASKSSTNEFNKGDNMNANDDLFNSWKDFTRSNEAPTQTISGGTSFGHTPGKKSMDLQQMDFGDFLYSDLRSGSAGQEGSNKVNGVQLDASVSTSSNVKLNHTKNVSDEDNSFDDWQDFISSNESPGGLQNLSTQTNTKATSYESGKTINDVDDSFEDWKDFTSSNSTSGGLGNLSPQISTKDIPSESTKNTNGEDDSFEDWQEFTGSSEAPGGLGNLSRQTSTMDTSYEHPSGTNPLDLQVMEFGSFLQSDPFFRALGKGLTEVKYMQNASRMNGLKERTGSGSFILGAANGAYASNRETSQMPDLSFLLDNLSIPKKADSFDLNS